MSREIAKVLCVVDPAAETQPAVERAQYLASAFAAELHLYVAYESSQLDSIAGGLAVSFEQYRDDVLEVIQDRLDTLAKQARGSQIRVSTCVEWVNRATESICERADDIGADLIVKDTHYHSAIARALTTHMDWQLIRHCNVPLWLVRAETEFSSAPTIVACVDPQQTGKKSEHLDDIIIAEANSIGEALNANVQVLHAYQPLIELGNAAKWALRPNKLPVDKLRSRIRLHHKKAFDALCDRLSIEPQQRNLLEGSVSDVIPGFLMERQASLVVLGAASHRNLKSLLVGQTAEKILDHSPCDMLVTKHND